MKSKGNGGKRSRRGRRARFIRSDEPGLRPDGPLAGGSRSPLHPRSRYVPGGSSSPIPRSARILKGLVVNICLSHHRGFVIGERLWRPVRIRNRQLYCSVRVVTAGRYRKSQSIDLFRAPLWESNRDVDVLL